MPETIILRDAFLIDCTGREPQENMAVVVEGKRIADVVAGGRVTVPSGATVIDCRGYTLMPGLSDAHVHICTVDVNILEQHRLYPPSLLMAKALRILEDTLQQGYTTVRDAGGGAMSPADEIDTTQFTVPEIQAAVEEARAVGKYVMAHLYSASSVSNAIQAGVRSLEHGNLMTEESARMIHEAGAFLVPTLTTYEMLAEEGLRYGVPEANIRKIHVARQHSIAPLKLAHQAGIKIGSGSDLLGSMQQYKARELALKAQVLSPMEALLSATKVNAELFGLERDIGTVEPGKSADLLVVRGNPL